MFRSKGLESFSTRAQPSKPPDSDPMLTRFEPDSPESFRQTRPNKGRFARRFVKRRVKSFLSSGCFCFSREQGQFTKSVFFPSLGGLCEASLNSVPNVTGRPGYRTMEMNGGSSAPDLTCTPCVPCFVL